MPVSHSVPWPPCDAMRFLRIISPASIQMGKVWGLTAEWIETCGLLRYSDDGSSDVEPAHTEWDWNPKKYFRMGRPFISVPRISDAQLHQESQPQPL
ncbi:hypothetical protein VCV18_000236 [Metarhizium anisopliae]